MQFVYFDCETYSECDLKKAGAYAYAAHPTTEIMCLTYATPGQDVKIWVPGDPIPRFTDLGLDEHKFAAWNAQFDAEIWRLILCNKHGWPWPGYHCFYDVMVGAAYMGLPLKLEQASAALNATPKDMDGHKLMMKLCKPANLTKNLKDPKRFHTEENLKRLYYYGKTDTKVLREIGERIKELPYYEETIRLADHNMNARGIKGDMPFVKCALAMRDKRREHIQEEIEYLTNGIITSPTKRKEILAYLEMKGVKTDSVAKDIVKEIVDEWLPRMSNQENAADVERVLDLYQQYNKTSLAKYVKMQHQACPDDRWRGQQQMYGAHTGRWAGRGVQCQNLFRGIFKNKAQYQAARDAVLSGDYDLLCIMYDTDDVMDVLATLIRAAFIAGDGMELHVSDYSSIEARVAFWLTGDKEGLNIYYNMDGRLYEATAASIYKINIDKVTKPQRAFGKTVSLAAQYQVGEKTIYKKCKEYGIKTTLEACKEAKDAYRNKFTGVVKYWGELESAAVWAVKNPRQIINVGILKLCFYDGLFRIRLPSGRIMFYFDAKIQWKDTPWGEPKECVTYMGIDQYTRRWARMSTYGGKLFENVVQAIARDLMAEAIVRAEDCKMHPVLTVHDELVIEELINQYTIADLDAVMTALPKWAEGLPVEAEGWTGQFYMKT